MKILQPSVEVEQFDGKKMLRKIEAAARTCYKSDAQTTDTSAENFIKHIIKNGHESVLEHEKITVRIICDRGVSHELVRHRTASFSQESTRYVNYKDGIEVIKPCFWNGELIHTDKYHDQNMMEGTLNKDSRLQQWYWAMNEAEKHYKQLIEMGATPQEARSVLPNSLKTEIVVTMDLRAWRHFFKLRCASSSHPQMRQIAFMLLSGFSKRIPVVFEDIVEDFERS